MSGNVWKCLYVILEKAIEQPLRYSAIAKNRVIDEVLVAMSVKYWMEECWKWVTWINQVERIERA